MQYSATITGLEIKPYCRMTQRSKWVDPRAIEYRASQERLAWALKSQGQGKVEQYPVSLTAEIRFVNKRKLAGDVDNYAKAIADALQLAGILKDDNLRHVQAVHCQAGHGADNLITVRIE